MAAEVVQTLYDVYDGTREIRAVVKCTERGISIEIDGYGSANGANEVVLIELSTVPQVVVWGDRDREDPTNIIGLGKAKLPIGDDGWIGNAGTELDKMLAKRGTNPLFECDCAVNPSGLFACDCEDSDD